MSKCCENCEHRTVCEIYHNPKFKMTKCTEWSGWHDVKEEPPVKDKNVLLFVDGESVGFGWIHNDCYYALWDDLSSFEAIRKERVTHWRELPKYEVEK